MDIISLVVGYLLGVISMMILAYCVGGLIPKSVPRAMDVYQGKTTLEITYRDSVVVDSVVVFKKR